VSLSVFRAIVEVVAVVRVTVTCSNPGKAYFDVHS